MIRTFVVILLTSAAPVAADVAFLNLPLDCVLGETCVIEDYPDVDPTEGTSDYRCGLKSRDKHIGTDFALLSFEQMQAGVNVLAAADGRVAAVRTSMPDQVYVDGMDLGGQDCGNAVRVDHGNGYQSIYCHLKRGTIYVARGDTVRVGEVLGQVGLSGRTNYPHLHLTITQGENVIDPFAADKSNACGVSDDSLWIDPPIYSDAGLFTAGVSNAVPSMEGVQTGDARREKLAPSEPMVLYGYVFHGDPGDQIQLDMMGPDGEVFAHTTRLDAEQAQLFRAFGRRAPTDGWRAGAYRGTVTLLRNGFVHAVRHADVTVE